MSNPSPLFDESDIIKCNWLTLPTCYVIVELPGLDIKRQVIGTADVVLSKDFLKHRRGS